MTQEQFWITIYVFGVLVFNFFGAAVVYYLIKSGRAKKEDSLEIFSFIASLMWPILLAVLIVGIPVGLIVAGILWVLFWPLKTLADWVVRRERKNMVKPTKEEVQAVYEEVDDLGLQDGAHWALCHERLGLHYGELFPLMIEYGLVEEKEQTSD